jgi:hypothetical protein
MNRRGKRFLFAGAAALVLVFIIYYFFISWPGILTRWQRVTPPPEQILSLRQKQNGEILGQTSSGNLYQFTGDPGSPWKKIGSDSEMVESSIGCSPVDERNYAGYLILPPPGKVISSASEHCVVTESAYRLKIILLENGEVWLWRYDHKAYSSLFLPCIVIGGVGFGLSFLLFGLLIKIKKE